MSVYDLKEIKRGLKTDSAYLRIEEIFINYIKKDNGEVIHSESKKFDFMSADEKDLYLKNFKKVLSGTVDKNIFEIPFIKENNFQNDFINGVDNIKPLLEKIKDNLIENYKYEGDIVLNVALCNLAIPSRNKNNEDEDEDYIDDFTFMIGSINKPELPNKSVRYNYNEHKFDITTDLDILVNMSSPLEGFMFPSFEDGSANVNKLVYYTKKPGDLDKDFVEKVFTCEIEHTIADDSNKFINIMSDMVNQGIEPEKLQTVYRTLETKIEDEEEDEEDISLNCKELKNILKDCDVEVSDLEYEENTDLEMKIRNIVPDSGTKSLKIKTSDFDISVSPDYLDKVSLTTNNNGRKIISIEVNNDVEINGLKIK